MESKQYYLPRPMMVVVASYLNNYQLGKLFVACSYFMECVQDHYNLMHRTIIDSKLPLDEEEEK